LDCRAIEEEEEEEKEEVKVCSALRNVIFCSCYYLQLSATSSMFFFVLRKY
jgi:hypothetical protein